MLDIIEQPKSLSAMLANDLIEGGERPTGAQAMVPMLGWPSDLFNTFTTEINDENV